MISRCARRRLVRLAKAMILKRNGRHEESGISSCFFKISECWGVKYTRKGSEYMAETFRRHRIMWRHAVAPFCFGFFSCRLAPKFGCEDGRELHVYIVQLVDVCSDIARRDRESKIAKMFEDDIYMENCECLKKIFQKIYKKIKDHANKIWTDNHWHNFGLLNGKWVVIDWGHESFYGYSHS